MTKTLWIILGSLLALGVAGYFWRDHLHAEARAATGKDGDPGSRSGKEGKGGKEGKEGKDGAPARVVPVLTTVVATRDVPIYLDGLGNVTAFKTVMVKSQVDGRLDHVLFREGQAVKQGDLLAEIDARTFIIQRQQAEGALARDNALLRDAKQNLDRYVSLKDSKLVAQQQVDDQQALVGQYQGAILIDQSQVDAAKLQIEYARITSPVDGVTGVRLVDPGNLVHPADANAIAIVTQIDPIAVLFTLPQDDLPAVAAQLQKGPVAVEAYGRDGLVKLGTGKLTLIDNQINQTTATMRLKAVFPNPEHKLWPNQFVKSRLLLTVRKGAMVVPTTVVQRGPQGTFAYVVGADDTVSTRPVEVESTAADQTLIASGLKVGDVVVVDGQNQLRPGSKVSSRPTTKPPGPGAQTKAGGKTATGDDAEEVTAEAAAGGKGGAAAGKPEGKKEDKNDAAATGGSGGKRAKKPRSEWSP